MRKLWKFLTTPICVQFWTQYTIDYKQKGIGIHRARRVWFIPLTPRFPRKLNDPW